MDDRRTESLYLELVDLDREIYLNERAPQILAGSGAERLTCWQNLVPNRSDLPRRLDEFRWLAVFEADLSFIAPAGCDGVVGLHFIRTARPGQGRLSPNDTVGLLLVLISPKYPAESASLRAWADFVHLKHIAEAVVPGYAMITPYERSPSDREAGRDEPLFLHFYEMDTVDAEAAFQRMTPMVAARLGGFESPDFERWAGHQSLRIDYVSTFRRIGEPRTPEP